jgi:hypothetical protein
LLFCREDDSPGLHTTRLIKIGELHEFQIIATFAFQRTAAGSDAQLQPDFSGWLVLDEQNNYSLCQFPG